MKIDNTTHKVDDANFYKVESSKSQIVISISLRKDGNHITRLKHKSFGKSKKWNTYTITRDGVIFEHYPSKYYGDFIGIKQGDRQSITIVLENMGCLFNTSDENYVNWLNEECDGALVINKRWMGYDYWESFTDNQINSLTWLCRHLCEKHGINLSCIDFQYYHKDVVKYMGIVFMSNYIEDTNNISPLFDIEKFNELLLAE